ncbi:hypothetical protein [Planosporangium mesophilum]|uniref:PPE family domain-containing protein n=1 Tax=Planosporangium mesophilum TaxID=689768 RepID=A0A8J3T9D2_9ACTN|nr:hypothetical protein [Planosporangium mesophilum]NJC81335.1 hypothetical protein [Planosporangium mesophilum]GII21012.1 hypothetical protein Pme01_06090 [Planosporangium mesophilum]
MSSGDEKYYGGFCTNWAAYDLPVLWNSIKDEGRPENYEQGTSWQRTYELLAYHMSELQRCRDDLAAKWPRDQSPAAGVFLDYIDNLMGSMKQMSEDALANSSAVTGISTALLTARGEIKKLNDQWQEYEHKEKNPDKLLGFIPLGADVPDDWRKDLRNQAAKHMVEADTQVFQHTSKMVVPEVYQGPPYFDSSWTPDSASGTSSAPGGGAGGGSRVGGAGWARPPVIPPPTMPDPSFAESPTGGAAAPVLSGGTSAPIAPPAPTPPAPPIAPAPPPGVITPPLMPFPGGPTSSTGGAVPAQRSGGSAPVRAGAGSRAGGMAPGGVIGGAPPAGRPAAAGGARANPVGGVIGGGNAAGGPRTAAAGGNAMSGGAPVGGRRGPNDRDGEGNRFDPDDPWAVAEGVPGVLAPNLEREQHEPGPGVIGIDR